MMLPLHTTRHLPLLAAVGALVLTFLPASPARAATITWDTPTLISADTDVSTTGSLLYAYTLGDTGVPSVTLNGVTFASFAVPDGSTADVPVGSVTLAVDQGFGDTFNSSNTLAGSGASPFPSLSSAYQDLLRSAVSTFDEHTTDLLTLTLGGLTNGQSYLVQFWANDSRGTFFTLLNNGTVLNAGNAVTLDNNSTDSPGGVGQWVTGTFTASGTTQTVTLQSSNLGKDVPMLNAFQVRTVPEPSSVLLLLAGGVFYLCWRTARRHDRNA